MSTCIGNWARRGTYRPDFKVNSPKSKTPFLRAASMKATFSASTAVVEDLATLIVCSMIYALGKKKKKKKRDSWES